MVAFGRPRDRRWRRVHLYRQPQEGPDHQRRCQHRQQRGRERHLLARSGARGCGRKPSRRGMGRTGPRLRVAARRQVDDARGAHRLLPRAARTLQVPGEDRHSARPAEERAGQDPEVRPARRAVARPFARRQLKVKSRERNKMLKVTAMAVAVGLFAASASNAQSQAPIKVGAVLSLSGPAAVFGLPERDAIEAVVEEINRTGGVNGRKIELVLHDDKTDPSEAVRGVTQVTRDGVVAIVGPSTGSGILAAGPVAERLRVPLLAPAGTASITDKKNSFYPWVFRVAPSDQTDIHKILADIAKDGKRRIGVFYQEDAYGKVAIMAAIKAVKGDLSGPAMRDALETICDFPTYSRGKGCFSKEVHDGWGEDVLVITEVDRGRL